MFFRSFVDTDACLDNIEVVDLLVIDVSYAQAEDFDDAWLTKMSVSGVIIFLGDLSTSPGYQRIFDCLAAEHSSLFREIGGGLSAILMAINKVKSSSV